jgi:hypothetical protein
VCISGFLLVAGGCDSYGSTGYPTNPGGNNNGSSKVISMNVNGIGRTASTVSGAWLGTNFVMSGTFGTNGGSLNISANAVSSTGTYQLGPGNSGGFIATWVDTNGQHSSLASGGGGSINITILTPSRISGTFQFTAATTVSSGQPHVVNITNGSFNIIVP